MTRQATIDDIHATALGMPHVTVARPDTLPIYQVGSKSFVFFRTPRPDAFDPETGERYADVIVFWVASDGDKLALVQDETTPFFTTPYFDGHPSVLLRGSRVSEVDRDEIVADACRGAEQDMDTRAGMSSGVAEFGPARACSGGGATPHRR